MSSHMNNEQPSPEDPKDEHKDPGQHLVNEAKGRDPLDTEIPSCS